MTKNDRFKTYTQLEKIGKRILSHSVHRPKEFQHLETEFREILLALAGNCFPKIIRSDHPTTTRWYPVGG